MFSRRFESLAAMLAVTLWAIAMLPLTLPCAAQSYNVVKLGPLPGTDSSYGLLVNGNGDVACMTTYTSGLTTYIGQAFFWSQATGVMPIPLLGSGTSAHVLAMNGAGQIIGYANTQASVYSPSAFLWDKRHPNSITNIGVFGGYQYSKAESINNTGSVVGQAWGGAPSELAFVWDPVRGARFLANLLPTDTSIPLDDAFKITNVDPASGDCQILAHYYDPAAGVDRYFRLTYDEASTGLITSIVELPDEAKGLNMVAQAAGMLRASDGDPYLASADASPTILDLGTIPASGASTGYNVWNLSDMSQMNGEALLSAGNVHSWFWDSSLGSGRLLDLGTLGGNSTRTEGVAYVGAGATVLNDTWRQVGMSSSGWIVGGSYTSGNKQMHAFVWKPTRNAAGSVVGTIYDLNNLIASKSGFQYLLNALCINDAAWVVGQGLVNGGKNNAFVLIPR